MFSYTPFVRRVVAGSGRQLLRDELPPASAATPARNQERHLQNEDNERLYQGIFEAMSDGLILTDVETGLVVEANPAASAMHGYGRQEFIGLHRTLFMHPDSQHLFPNFIQTVQSGDILQAEAVHLRRDGTPFHVETRGVAFLYQQRPCLLSVIRDISDRVQSRQQLQQQVTARLREQATLLDISQTLASALELKPGLILDQMGVIIEHTQAALFSLEGLTLVALAVRGPQRLKEAMPFHVQLEGPATLAALLNGRQPQRIANVWSDDPAAILIRSLLHGPAAGLLEGVQAWLWTPLAVEKRIIGAVVMARAEPDSFTTHHADLALTVANQAAITLVNAHLYKQAQTLATIQERQRLAQNLHDAVNQSLFSASLIAEVLPRLWLRNPEEAQQSLEDLRRLTRGAMAEMRGLLAELRPLVLTDSDLGDLLRQLGDALTGRTNIPVQVTVAGEGSLPTDVQVAFYRVCQEALNNIAKHAWANQVELDLRYNAGAAELHIRDNGRGFDLTHIPAGHYGLSMMRERAKAIGAKLSVSSQPGQGAEIVIRWSNHLKEESPMNEGHT
ncbi:MAG: PAS domain S-box protein [Anaerolineae bacterium]|nr:PAS domain S-box protein [Anaerolineae bacterium]